MLSHVISFSLVGSIIYVSQPGTSLFSWHPVLMTLAFATLVVEAILSLSRNSVFGTSHASKAKAHWVLMLGAVVTAVAGFVVIYMVKENYGKQHFTTPHGICGGITVLYIIVQCLAGINVLNPRFITKFVPYKTLRKAHGLSGLFLFLLSCMTMIGGITSDWFVENVAIKPLWYFCLACPLVLFLFLAKQVFGAKSTAGSKKQS